MVAPHLNRTILIRELLEEFQLGKGDWRLTVYAHAPRGNFDLAGCLFVNGRTRWLTSTPAMKR
jgi:hypothetical protein